MKAVFVNIIKKGGYDLEKTLAKIDTYHILGKLTDEERDELYALARTAPEGQYDIQREIERLWVAVRELQGLKDGENDGEEGTETIVPEWKQPTGAHDAYMEGDVMRYTDGCVYKSLANNNVWSPDVMPSYWGLVG